MKKRIVVQGTLVFAAIALGILLPGFFFSVNRRGIFDVLGLLFILLGFLFRISARGYKEQMSASGSQLVKGGPYSLIRNPMYFGTLVIGIGIIVMFLKVWTLPVFICVYMLIYLPQIKKEEKILSERFKEEYTDYCKQTPKYFPKIFPLSGLKNIFSPKWQWIKKELPSLIVTLLAIVIIKIIF